MSAHSPLENLPDEALLRQRDLVRRRIDDAASLLPFSSSTLWRLIAKGVFPAPIKLPGKMIAWRVRDVREWLRSVAERSK